MAIELGAVAIGDLNEDGRADLVVANKSAWTVSVLVGIGDGTFATHTDYPTGVSPTDVAIGDLGDDGPVDLAVVEYGEQKISILRGNGDGTFEPRLSYWPGQLPNAVAIHDWNGDGRADLAVACEGNQHSHEGDTSRITLFHSTSDGALEPPIHLSLESGPTDVATADVNGDGRMDLLAANQVSRSVSILFGNADGTLSPVIHATGRGPLDAVLADLDADRRPDLVVANQLNTISVLRGEGDGRFAPQAEFPTGLAPRSVAVGDVNGDATPDVVAACWSSNAISVLLGHGDGTLGPSADFGTGSSPSAVVLEDLDGDARLDAAAALSRTGAVAILRGHGDGQFGPPAFFPLDVAPTDDPTKLSLESSDLNGDGHLDLAGLSTLEGMRVLLGNGDGTFAAPMTVIYPTGRAPGALVIGDLDGDGDADLAVTSRDSIDVLLGHGDGTFASKRSSPGLHAHSIDVADFDRDFRLDIALAYGPHLAVSLGNGDGSFRQPSSFGTGRGSWAVVAGDLNADRRDDLVAIDIELDGAIVLLNNLVPVPVAVLDFDAVEMEGGVLLEWMLGREALAEAANVRVERASAEVGPFIEITSAPLVATTHMTFMDALGSGGSWYRLVIEMRDGSRVVAARAMARSSPRSSSVTALHPPIRAADGVHVRYDVARAATVHLRVFDVRGRIVATLANGAATAGRYWVLWSPAGLARGVYLVHLDTGAVHATRKLALLSGRP